MNEARIIAPAVAALLFAAASAFAQSASAPPPLEEAGSSTIGYPTVAAALAAVRTSKGAVISQKEGWTVIEQQSPLAVWMFAPSSDPAYPAVVKRSVVNEDGGAYMKTSIRCEASKRACDAFARRFQ